MKGLDLCIAALLLDAPAERRHQPTTWLAQQLGVSTSSIHASLKRLYQVRLLLRSNDVVDRSYLEFLEHGLRYVMPIEIGGPERGVPTDIATQPLRAIFEIGSGDLPRVWAHPAGEVRGLTVVPIHPSVPSVALVNDRFHAQMALIDGCRLEDPRIRRESARALRELVDQPLRLAKEG